MKNVKTTTNIFQKRGFRIAYILTCLSVFNFTFAIPFLQAKEAKEQVVQQQISMYLMMLGSYSQSLQKDTYVLEDIFKNIKNGRYIYDLENENFYKKKDTDKKVIPALPKHLEITSSLPENIDTPPPIMAGKLSSPMTVKLATPSSAGNPKEGVIGISAEFPYDNPSDNVFKVDMSDLPTDGEALWLSYDVYGVEGISGVSTSFNSNIATGGYMVKLNQEWETVREPIDLSSIKEEGNFIRFSVPENAGYSYKIKNVHIYSEAIDGDKDILLAESQIILEKNGQTYLKGIVKDPSYKNIYVNNRFIKTQKNGIFEGLVDITSKDKENGYLEFKIVKYDNTVITKQISISENLKEADFLFNITPILPTIDKSFGSEESKLDAYGATVYLPSGALDKEAFISITELRSIDIMPMEPGMANVTLNQKGFRFLPHGIKFLKDGKVSIPYDANLIPEGNSVEDIRTYYFDEATGHWQALELDSIDQQNKLIISKTNHFTDMINGVIQVPESPQTNAFAPTMMNDVKAADPTAGLNLMQPPSASQDGATHISYPLNIPAGRRGMQPNLAIQYNSEGGNGWMGLGWNISVPAITLDTRWGVPEFASHESEIYLLAGEQLVYPKTNETDDAPYLPHRHTIDGDGLYDTSHPQARNGSGSKIFYLRKEGSFTKIERLGNNPTAYYWKVTATDGTISWYGGTETGISSASILKNDNGNIVHWGLTKTIDVFGNNILYSYSTVSDLGGKQLYLNQVSYTGKNTTAGPYIVTFNRDTSIARPDISINGRLKFKQVEARRLDNIEVKYNSSLIRKYKFNYTIGLFNKSLLKEIIEYNEDNIESQKHTLNYHDDITKGGGALYTTPQTVAVGDIDPSFLLNMDNIHIDELTPSKLGSQQSTNLGWEISPFLGGASLLYIGGSKFWCMTLGTNMSQSKTENRGMVMMTDIDGNGIDDIVYRTENGLKYVPRSVNRTQDFNGNFTYSYPIHPTQNLMRTDGYQMQSFLYSDGYAKTKYLETGELNTVFQSHVGFKKFETNLDTDIYFTDGNGDGLPDIVDNGVVYFNRIQNGVPKFNTSSAETPNMLIVASTALDESDYDPPTPETGEKNYDVVRMWQAPYRGTIKISDNVQIQGNSPDTRIIYSIETAYLDNPTSLYRLQLLDIADHLSHSFNLDTNLGATIPLGNSSLQGQSIHVEAGQKIFFRIHNLGESSDAVNWDPEIEFLTRETTSEDEFPLTDENNYSTINSNYSDSFLLTNDNDLDLPGTGKVYINWGDISILSPSDDVTYQIFKRIKWPNGNVDESTVFKKTFIMGVDDLFTDAGGIEVDIDKKVYGEGGVIGLFFQVYSDSNVKWKDLEWKPVAVYDPDANAVAHGIPDTNITVHVTADYTAHEMNNGKGVNIKSYSNLIIKPRTGWAIPSSSAQYGILPNTSISLSSANNGSFSMIIKNNNLVIDKRTVSIIAGNVSLPDDTPIIVYTGNLNTETNYKNVSVEFYANNINNAKVLENYLSANGNQAIRIGYDWTQPASSNKYYKSSAVNVFYNKSPYGAMVHNWGQFFYNETFDDPADNIPSDSYGKLINYNWVADPFLHINITQLLTDLGIDINEDYTEEEAEQIFYDTIQPPGGDASEAEWDAYNEAMTLIFEELAKPRPILFAKALRNEDGDKKWIGFFSSQYIKSNSSYLGDLGDVWGETFEDPNPVITPMQADLETGMYGIPKKSKSVSHSKAFGAGNLTYSISKSGLDGKGYSRSITDFMDINGDRYPDIIYPTQTQFTTMTGGHKSVHSSAWGHITESEIKSEGATNNSGYLDAGILNSPEAKGIDGSFADQINAYNETCESSGSSSSQKVSVSGSVRIGIGVDLGGYSKTNKYWGDLNGDGLPDLIEKSGSSFGFKLNKGQTSAFGSNETFAGITATKSTPGALNLSIGASGSISSMMDQIDNQPDDFGFSFSISVGASANTGNTDVNILDINGDGLVDLVKLVGDDEYKVYFNKGNGFNTNGYDLKYISGSLDLEKQTQDVSFNAGADANLFFGFPVFFILWVPFIYVKFGGGGSIHASLTKSDTQKSIQDFDGDGYPDFIEKSGESVKVYYSRIRRSNKLASVTNPLGGKFELDYSVVGNTYEMPQGKWVLSKVTVTPKNPFFTEKKNTKYFKYENGYYDRREREFYGFETVKTMDLKAGTNPTNYSQVENNAYRTQINRYHNRSYFLKGLLKESYIIKGGFTSTSGYGNIPTSQLFTKSVNTYVLNPLTNDHKRDDSETLPLDFDTGGSEGRNTAVVTLKQTDNYVYELTSNPKHAQQKFEYDEYARIAKMENKGDTSTSDDDYESTVSYHDDAGLLNKNILSVPEKIEVKVPGANGYLRKRETDNIDLNTGAIGTISAYYKDENNNEASAQTDMTYNADGNLKTITYPENANSNRVKLTYSYDTFIRNNVTEVEDNLGYGSSSVYEPKYGNITQTEDTNGNIVKYKYDKSGRLVQVNGPKEPNQSSQYTIKLEYHPLVINDAANTAIYPYAISKHFDIQNPSNPIETYTLTDGVGRVIQVKKDIDNQTLGTTASNEKMSVSGKIVTDIYGRAIAQYQPYFESKNSPTNQLLFSGASQFVYPTTTEYDELDRVKKVTLPASGHTTTMTYTLANDGFAHRQMRTQSVTKQSSSVNITTQTFTDVNGRTTSVMNKLTGTNPDDIWTKYKYDNIGQLVQVIDDGGNIIESVYDLLGRRVEMTHPDAGTNKYWYDPVGNLIKMQTPNLLTYPVSSADQFIKYTYDGLNRLTEITYPPLPATGNLNNVAYFYGGPNESTPNAIGKLIIKQDATGKEEFEYGNMGELTKSTRYIVAPNLPDRKFIHEYEYDSWNRLQKLIYPDGEAVFYTYDLGGNLLKMTGQNGSNPYDYIKQITYDEFEQRTAIKYGNNTVNTYEYSPELRRLRNSEAKQPNGDLLFDFIYEYDYVGNITNLRSLTTPVTNKMGGSYTFAYTYDNLNRLKTSNGSFTGYNGASPPSFEDLSANYTLTMSYDALHNITNKTQSHTRDGASFADNTYNHNYHYASGTPHRLKDIQLGTTSNREIFKYDKNGNMTEHGGGDDDWGYFWDESNRLRSAVENGVKMTHFIYDAAGERTLKAMATYHGLYENGTPTDEGATLGGYTTYPSPYVTVDSKSQYTKHYFAGTQRIASKPAGSASVFNVMGTIGGLQELKDKQFQDAQAVADTIGIGELDLGNDAVDPGDPPVNIYSIFYFHSDHLGSSTVLTDASGYAYQLFLNLPFGETMAEQRRSGTFNNVYKFNGKELDANTGLYYYGARYYNPRISNWLSVDPIALWQPVQETQHYIEGQHNGGYFNPKNMSVYGYTYQNPIVYVDPNGKQSYFGASFLADDSETRTKIAQAMATPLNSDTGHLVLDGMGLIPGIGEGADVANGIWYAFEGDYVNAGLSIGAAVPFVGWGATGAKATVRALKLSDNALHSASGLIYKLGGQYGNRLTKMIEHHTVNNLTRDFHGIWNKNMSNGDIVETVDNAWNYVKKNNIQGTLQSNGNRVYDVPMAGQVGTQGGKLGNGGALNNVRIIVKDGTSEVITAFPK